MALGVNKSVFDFSKITKEISQSVNNIKGKSSALRLKVPNSEISASSNYDNFSKPYLATNTSYSINQFVSDNPSSERPEKVAESYDYVANVNAKKNVLIDFVHEFNRNYDFSI